MAWQPIEDADEVKASGQPILGAWRGHEEWMYGVFMWRESVQYPGLYGWYFLCTERFSKPEKFQLIDEILDEQPLPDPPS